MALVVFTPDGGAYVERIHALDIDCVALRGATRMNPAGMLAVRDTLLWSAWSFADADTFARDRGTE
jgi:hypothetical protein